MDMGQFVPLVIEEIEINTMPKNMLMVGISATSPLVDSRENSGMRQPGRFAWWSGVLAPSAQAWPRRFRKRRYSRSCCFKFVERQPAYPQFGDIGMLTGVLHIDSDDAASFVEIDDHTVRDFVAIRARALHQMNVERIGFGVV
jgi:hypothetical protein